MNRVFRAFLLLIFTAFSMPAAPVKVVCWNLEWFPGGKPDAKQADKKKHMKAAQEALKVINPDVLCLQEVRDWKAVQELVSVIPGMRVDVVSRFDGDQQQAIASKLPVDSSWAQKWDSGTVADIPRGYSFAALQMPDGGFLLVYSLHMKANGRGDDAVNIAKREESSRQLVAHAIEMQKLYGQRGKVGILMVGDWNTTLDENPTFDAETTLRGVLASGFKTAWEGVPFEQRITHPGSGGWPSITFDHILTLGLSASPASVQSFPGVSDHNPVVMTVAGLGEAPPIAQPSPIPAVVEAAPEPVQKAVSPGFAPEDGLQPVQVREIIMTPPTFTDVMPGTKPRASPVPVPDTVN